jgi:hypothetical protein
VGTTTTSTSSTTTSTLPAGVTLIPSNRLVLKDHTSPTPDPNRRRFAFNSSTSSVAPANQIVPPPNGTPDDPVAVGTNSTLYVYNSSGLTTDVVTIPLTGGWSSSAGAVYWYRPTVVGAPISRVLLKPNKLVVKGGRAGFSYSLDEPAQGSVAVRLVVGSRTWCANALAKRSGNPPSTVRTDRVDKFVGQPKALAASCPPIP